MTNTAPARGRWLGLVALTLGVAMIIVDATILNVAVPSIIRDLDVSFRTAQWANTIYAVVFASLLITAGRLGDIVGRRRMFVAGIVIFVGASVAAGLATSGSTLLIARFVQGIGGAIILPSTLANVNASFQGRERAIAFGVWGAVIGGVVALGPLLGGWLTTNQSWRWAFYINVPVGLLAALVVLRTVAESRDEAAVRRFDVPGTLTLATGLAALVFATIEGRTYGWWFDADGGLSLTPLIALAGIMLCTAFVVIERRRVAAGRVVLVDFHLLGIQSFRNGNLAAAVVSLGEFGVVFVVPLYFQAVLGYSAFQSGLVLLALSGGAFLAGGGAAPLTQRIGGKRVVVLGMLLEVIGIAAFALLTDATATGWTVAPGLFVYGLGVGFATAQLTSLILADVPIAQSGQASGIQSTARQVGSALGIAIIGTIFITSLSSGADRELRAIEQLPDEARRGLVLGIEQSGGALAARTADGAAQAAVTEAFDTAFVDAVRHAGFAAAGFVLLGLVAALRMPVARVGNER